MFKLDYRCRKKQAKNKEECMTAYICGLNSANRYLENRGIKEGLTIEDLGSWVDARVVKSKLNEKVKAATKDVIRDLQLITIKREDSPNITAQKAAMAIGKKAVIQVMSSTKEEDLGSKCSPP